MIPGTAGVAPVQNAGAYGQEIADTLVECEAYDTLREREFVRGWPATTAALATVPAGSARIRPGGS